MITEFDKYSMSGALICMCGMNIMALGIIKPGTVECNECGRIYLIKRPVIELVEDDSQ